jgi:hypothetical protein
MSSVIAMAMTASLNASSRAVVEDWSVVIDLVQHVTGTGAMLAR